jgi:hypothetical protein
MSSKIHQKYRSFYQQSIVNYAIFYIPRLLLKILVPRDLFIHLKDRLLNKLLNIKTAYLGFGKGKGAASTGAQQPKGKGRRNVKFRCQTAYLAI